MAYYVAGVRYEAHPIVLQLHGYREAFEMPLRELGFNPFHECEKEDLGRVMNVCIPQELNVGDLLLKFARQLYARFFFRYLAGPASKKRYIIVSDKGERLKIVTRERLTFNDELPPRPPESLATHNPKGEAFFLNVIANQPRPSSASPSMAGYFEHSGRVEKSDTH